MIKVVLESPFERIAAKFVEKHAAASSADLKKALAEELDHIYMAGQDSLRRELLGLLHGRRPLVELEDRQEKIPV